MKKGLNSKVKPLFMILFLFFLDPLLSSAQIESYEIVVGEILSVKTFSPQKIFIRKPEVLEIVKVKENRIEFLGKKTGFTQVEVWEKTGKRIFEVNVLSEDLNSLKEKISQLINKELKIKDVVIRKDELNSKIILEGVVSKDGLDRINRVIEKYSANITNFLRVKEERDLVRIDVEVLELSKQLIDQLGIDWSHSMEWSESIANKSAGLGGTPSEVIRIVDWTRTALEATVNLWEKEGKGKILARPKLLCLSGKEASFLVGGEIPILTYRKGEPSVEYKEYGIKLNISPTIKDKGIVLNLRSEISEIDADNSLDVTVFIPDSGSSQYSVPAFTKRTTETQLFLKDGQSIFISGLLEDKVSKDYLNKVPGLADIPVLGALFRSKDYQRDQTELVISLTPQIIRYAPEEEELKKIASTYKPLVKEEEGISLPLANYIREIQRRISSALAYPALAEEAGWQGMVKLSLHLSSDGSLIAARIPQSSGYKVFDETVLRTVKEIRHYPPFPSSIEEKELWIEIPVVYKLD
ncbi:MAG: TonB family protein [Candidatus Omnitrophica bacterium]|nr:TonB family protein [Candidatus Omnitrophota bacterium]